MRSEIEDDVVGSEQDVPEIAQVVDVLDEHLEGRPPRRARWRSHDRDSATESRSDVASLDPGAREAEPQQHAGPVRDRRDHAANERDQVVRSDDAEDG